MRSIVFFFVLGMPLLLRADDTSLDSLPLAGRETIDKEEGDGVVKSAESYGWGAATIFRVEIDVDGAPALELQIAGNGKLIRVDNLQLEKDDEKDESEYPVVYFLLRVSTPRLPACSSFPILPVHPFRLHSNS